MTSSKIAYDTKKPLDERGYILLKPDVPDDIVEQAEKAIEFFRESTGMKPYDVSITGPDNGWYEIVLYKNPSTIVSKKLNIQDMHTAATDINPFYERIKSASTEMLLVYDKGKTMYTYALRSIGESDGQINLLLTRAMITFESGEMPSISVWQSSDYPHEPWELVTKIMFDEKHLQQLFESIETIKKGEGGSDD